MEIRTNFWCILKVEPTEFADRLRLGCKSKRGVKNLGLSKFLDSATRRMNLLFTELDPPHKRQAKRSKANEDNVITEAGREKAM